MDLQALVSYNRILNPNEISRMTDSDASCMTESASHMTESTPVDHSCWRC